MLQAKILNPVELKLLDLCDGNRPDLDEPSSLEILERCRQKGISKGEPDFEKMALLIYSEMLLEQGPDVDCREFKTGETPLIKAAHQCDVDLARILLGHQATVDLIDIDGGTALHAAASGGDFELASLLLEREADFLVKDKSGMIPLHYAIHCPKLVGLLLSLGSPVNAQCLFGNTPLNYATKVGAPLETLIILLAHGADFTLEDSDGHSPFKAATTIDAYPTLITLLHQKETALNLKSKEMSTQAKVSFLLGIYDDQSKMSQTEQRLPPEMYQEICVCISFQDFRKKAVTQLIKETTNGLANLKIKHQ